MRCQWDFRCNRPVPVPVRNKEVRCIRRRVLLDVSIVLPAVVIIVVIVIPPGHIPGAAALVKDFPHLVRSRLENAIPFLAVGHDVPFTDDVVKGQLLAEHDKITHLVHPPFVPVFNPQVDVRGYRKHKAVPLFRQVDDFLLSLVNVRLGIGIGIFCALAAGSGGVQPGYFNQLPLHGGNIHPHPASVRCIVHVFRPRLHRRWQCFLQNLVKVQSAVADWCRHFFQVHPMHFNLHRIGIIQLCVILMPEAHPHGIAVRRYIQLIFLCPADPLLVNRDGVIAGVCVYPHLQPRLVVRRFELRKTEHEILSGHLCPGQLNLVVCALAVAGEGAAVPIRVCNRVHNRVARICLFPCRKLRENVLIRNHSLPLPFLVLEPRRQHLNVLHRAFKLLCRAFQFGF